MSDEIKVVQYYYVEVPDRPGASADVLDALKSERVKLLVYTAFPTRRGRAQIDFVPADPRALAMAAVRAELDLVGPKSAFLVQGSDCLGAMSEIATSLAAAHINITAVDSVTVGRRFGAIVWVKPRNFRRAARALGAS